MWAGVIGMGREVAVRRAGRLFQNLMEYIKGETLERCWDYLSFWQKLRIA